MKRRMKTLSCRKELKMNAARFTTQTVVTSGSCVKRVLTRAMSKWNDENSGNID